MAKHIYKQNISAIFEDEPILFLPDPLELYLPQHRLFWYLINGVSQMENHT